MQICNLQPIVPYGSNCYLISLDDKYVIIDPSADYSEAVKWYRKAAEQGNKQAQYNLGVCYESGRGVPQDYSEAVKWYRKAAEQGVDYAKEQLQKLQEMGY